MNKFLKIFLITCVNLIIILLVIILIDFMIYKYHKVTFYKTNLKDFEIPKFAYQTKPEFLFDMKTFFNGQSNVFRGRLPDGLEYKDAIPIVVFGGSFGHCQYLNYDQTFSYKLAHALKRPVYNRSISGRGPRQMYLQCVSEDFYKAVPYADTVIYVMINDHYRRIYATHISMLDLYFLDNYKIKNGKIVEVNHNNPVLNVIKSSYLVKAINQRIIKNYLYNYKNFDKITDDLILYFMESKKEMEKRWNNNINFIVLIYDGILYQDVLLSKLRAQGIQAYIINDELVPDIDLYDLNYRISANNMHPNEKAWDIITQRVLEKVKF